MPSSFMVSTKINGHGTVHNNCVIVVQFAHKNISTQNLQIHKTLSEMYDLRRSHKV